MYKLVKLITIFFFFYSSNALSGHDNTASAILHEEKNDIQMFVLLKYSQIVIDINRGEGIYLDSLLHFLKKKSIDMDKGEKLQLLRQYLNTSQSIFHFSQRIKESPAE